MKAWPSAKPQRNESGDVFAAVGQLSYHRMSEDDDGKASFISAVACFNPTSFEVVC